MHRISLVLLCALMPGVAVAQQQLFRYVDRDGRVVYTDTAPPSDARQIQRKKLGGNFIETSEAPYALQIAQQRNPVTLYSGDCGPLCDNSRALLNRRGVPFREIDPTQPGEGAKLKQISGEMQVPVLVVGGAHVLRGFEAEKWQGVLDQAGYPKTPANRIRELKREAVEKGAVKVGQKSEPKDSKADSKDAKGDSKDARNERVAEAKPDIAPAVQAETKK
ncbi:MAG: glutaredoxin family protein [Betaproteobacteria bacterium]